MYVLYVCVGGGTCARAADAFTAVVRQSAKCSCLVWVRHSAFAGNIVQLMGPARVMMIPAHEHVFFGDAHSGNLMVKISYTNDDVPFVPTWIDFIATVLLSLHGVGSVGVAILAFPPRQAGVKARPRLRKERAFDPGSVAPLRGSIGCAGRAHRTPPRRCQCMPPCPRWAVADSALHCLESSTWAKVSAGCRGLLIRCRRLLAARALRYRTLLREFESRLAAFPAVLGLTAN